MIPQRLYRTLQAVILAGIALWLMLRILDGRVLFYINQRFVGLIFLAAVGCGALAQALLKGRRPVTAAGHDPLVSGWSLLWLAIPLVMGLLVPVQSLGSSLIAVRGVNMGALPVVRGSLTSTALEVPPTERTILDWVRLFSAPGGGAVYTGLPVDVTGFVYRDANTPSDYFVVSRFTITCCVADATAAGLVVHWPGAEALPADQWVRVRGNLSAITLNQNWYIAVEDAQVEVIPAPEQPYLFTSP